MAEITANVSWLAVIVGAIAAFIVGWLWYSPKMFLEKWAAGSRLDMGKPGDMPIGAMATQLIGLFCLSWFVGVTAANGHLLTLLLATAAFTLLAYSGNTFSQKNRAARLVDAGSWIVSVFLMIVAQALF